MIKRLIAIFTSSTQRFEGEQEGERVVLILRGHTFFIWSRLSIVLLLALLPFLARSTVGREQLALFWFGVSLWYLALWIMTFYFLTMHALNTIIITDRRIIESEQHGFFNRTVSELHAYRVQDVSVPELRIFPLLLALRLLL